MKSHLTRFIVLWFSFIFPFIEGKSQYNDATFLGDKSEVIIDFQLIQGFIIVDIYVEKILPMKFIFDTGAQNTVLFDKIYLDGFFPKYDRRINLLGADVSSELYAIVARNIPFKLKGCSEIKHDILVLEEDFVNISELIGVKVHGILGGEFLKNLLVDIDYKKQKIIISKPELYNYKKLSKYKKIPLIIKENKPYFEVKLNIVGRDTINAKLLLDTGAALTSMIQTNSHPALVMPIKAIKSNLGHGLGGLIEGYVGKVNYMDMNGFEFKNFISYFQDTENFLLQDSSMSRNGVLGNHLLQRFHVTIDFLNHYLYLKPNKKYNASFRYDRSGLTIFAYGEKLDEFVVKDVLLNSPASDADIRVDDTIIKINWLPSRFYILDGLSGVLSGKVGKKIKFKIKRGGLILKKEIVLRDLI